MDIKQELIKYIFLDIVGYSNNRTIEVQTFIISELNKIIINTLIEFNVNKKKNINIPTGDGICIALIDINKPFDLPLDIALSILSKIDVYNSRQENDINKFQIRIGINENIDNIIIDINGRKNVAGSGINYAQRIMNSADGNQILMGSSFYEKICDREKYHKKFSGYSTIIKHGIPLKLYQYVNKGINYLNNQVPTSFIKPVEFNKTVNQFIAIYICLIKKYQLKINDLISIYTNNKIFLHIIFIYSALYFDDILSKNIFNHPGLGYNFLKKYINDFNINIDYWINDLIKINDVDLTYLLNIENYLLNENIKNGYDYLFISDSDYFAIQTNYEKALNDEYKDLMEKLQTI